MPRAAGRVRVAPGVLLLLLAAAAAPCGALLMHPSLWADAVPVLVPGLLSAGPAQGVLGPSELAPNFAAPGPGEAAPAPGPAEAIGDVSVLGAQAVAPLERAAVSEPGASSAAEGGHLAPAAPLPPLPPLPHLPDLGEISAAERRLLRDGQRLWESLDAIRARLRDEPEVLASGEGRALLAEFRRRYRELEEV